MTHYPYLIVGGGMSAAAAIQGIREVDSAGAIGLIGSESHPPYQRPPLSKALWKGAAPDSVSIDLPRQGVDLLLEATAKASALDNVYLLMIGGRTGSSDPTTPGTWRRGFLPRLPETVLSTPFL